jgi:hypothetical protein
MAPTDDDWASKRIVYELPGMDLVEVRTDLLYGPERHQRFDVYLPERVPEGDFVPGVVFVHGDGPAELLRDAKNWGQYTSWGRLVAAAGLAGFTFNHRSSEQRTKLPQAADDVRRLLERVRRERAVAACRRGRAVYLGLLGGTARRPAGGPSGAAPFRALHRRLLRTHGPDAGRGRHLCRRPEGRPADGGRSRDIIARTIQFMRRHLTVSEADRFRLSDGAGSID